MLSLESKFSEALAAIKKAGLTQKFETQFTNIKESSIEVKLNCALEILKAANIIECFVEGAWGLTFTPKPHIQKKNGAAGVITESDRTVTKKEKLVENLVAKGMNESEARNFMGLKEKLPEGLTRLQETEYRFARRCGINESDSMKLAKMPLRVAKV